MLDKLERSKVGVVIGRFQGFTKAHLSLISTASAESERVIILVGSANRRSSIHNPWSFEQRKRFISDCIKDSGIKNEVVILPILDHPSNDIWSEQVNDVLDSNVMSDEEVTVFGCDKDDSSFYLKLFPNFKLRLIQLIEGFDATELRKEWFTGNQSFTLSLLKHNKVPPAMLHWLHTEASKPEFNEDVQAEWGFYQKEKATFANYPYPETLNFNCADAVVMFKDDVLMIKRGAAPGRNCWALPGGFKNNNETFLQTACRELLEEAGVQVSQDDIESCMTAYKVFDDPKRSLGIPRITMAFKFDLHLIMNEKPKVRAGDDASDAMWIDHNEVPKQNNIYDDHAKIIYDLTNNIE